MPDILKNLVTDARCRRRAAREAPSAIIVSFSSSLQIAFRRRSSGANHAIFLKLAWWAMFVPSGVGGDPAVYGSSPSELRVPSWLVWSEGRVPFSSGFLSSRPFSVSMWRAVGLWLTEETDTYLTKERPGTSTGGSPLSWAVEPKMEWQVDHLPPSQLAVVVCGVTEIRVTPRRVPVVRRTFGPTQPRDETMSGQCLDITTTAVATSGDRRVVRPTRQRGVYDWGMCLNCAPLFIHWLLDSMFAPNHHEAVAT